MELVGFRVYGVPPVRLGMGRQPKEDTFQLRHIAIEHARKLHDEGWDAVQCDEVTQWVIDGHRQDEEAKAIDFRLGGYA